MNHSDLFQQAIDATRELVRQEAKRGALGVSPEVARLLDSLSGTAAESAPSAPRAAFAEEVPARSGPAEPKPAPASAAAHGEPGDAADLESLQAMVAVCEKCPLHETRRNTVFGEGCPTADVVFVGEAPGAEEDRRGRPFVGRAGGLLTDIIEKGMKLKREDVYICNVLKCRPPMNRDPNTTEVMHCEPYLLRQLELMQPKVICCLGRVAAQTLLRTTQSTGRLRGQWHNYHGIPLRVTYHPAYLLRSPGEKRKAWEDIQQVMKVMSGELTPEI